MATKVMATKVKQASMITKDIKTMIDDAVVVASVGDLFTVRGLLALMNRPKRQPGKNVVIYLTLVAAEHVVGGVRAPDEIVSSACCRKAYARALADAARRLRGLRELLDEVRASSTLVDLGGED